jgi:hypothetical protein
MYASAMPDTGPERPAGTGTPIERKEFSWSASFSQRCFPTCQGEEKANERGAESGKKREKKGEPSHDVIENKGPALAKRSKKC